jgi:hypothetical protein
MQASRRTVPSRAEDAAVRGHQPVPRRPVGGHPHDGCIEPGSPHGAFKEQVEEKDAPVGGDEAIPRAVGCGLHADARLVQVDGPGRPIKKCITRPFQKCRRT